MAKKTLSSLDRLQETLAELKKTMDIQDKSEKAKKKRKKKSEKRKMRKKKHKKRKSKKRETRRLKRKKMMAHRNMKSAMKKQKQHRHKTHKKRIREKKKTLKARRVSIKSAKREPKEPLGEPLKEPLKELLKETREEPAPKPTQGPKQTPTQQPILRPKLENPVEEKAEEAKKPEPEEPKKLKEEKSKGDPLKQLGRPENPERPERPEQLDGELEKLLKEEPEPVKKSEIPPKPDKEDIKVKKEGLLPFKVKINIPGMKKKGEDTEEMRKEEKKRIAIKKITPENIELTGKSRSEMIKQLIVADVMSTDPITVKPDDKLSFAVRLFSNKKISGAPVVVERNIVGLISKSDIVKVIGVKDILDIDTPAFEKLKSGKVSDVMKKKVHFVRKYNKLSDAADIMNKNDINLLPVVDNKKRIIGIVSRGDIVRVVSKELLTKMVQQQRQAMKKMTKIETDIDNVLDMVEQAGSISILEISERLSTPEEKIEDWAKTMEKEGLLEIFYPAFGSPVLRKKLKKDVISFEEEES